MALAQEDKTMKKLKVTALLLAVITLVCSFSGCSDKVKYKAELYNVDEKFIRTDFAENNRISGSSFDYANGNESSEVHNSDELPPFRTFVIKDKQTYDCVFKDGPIVVNFDKEVIVLYTFTDCYRNRNYTVDKIVVDNANLVVNYKLDISFWEQVSSLFVPVGDASGPFQRFLALKIEKTDITEVKFEEVSPYFWQR